MTERNSQGRSRSSRLATLSDSLGEVLSFTVAGLDSVRLPISVSIARSHVGIGLSRSDELGAIVAIGVLGEFNQLDDHDSEGPKEMAHDVTEDGLHMDIYRDGEKYETEYIVGPLPADVALDLAEDHLAKNLERFVRRFEEWHGIRSDP